MRYPFSESDILYVSYLTIKENGVRRYGYLTIKGSVKNNGMKNVTHCILKLTKYTQHGNVISTDKLYVYGDIPAGKARTIHSMTAWPKFAKTYKLTIEEVRVG